jgi:hypothetical protein
LSVKAAPFLFDREVKMSILYAAQTPVAMKKLRPVAICLVIALIIVHYVSSASAYKDLFRAELRYNGKGLIFDWMKVLIQGLLNISGVVAGIMALSGGVENVREKAYSYFRYTFVMTGLVNFPVSLLIDTIYSKYLFSNAKTGLLIVSQQLFTLLSISLLLICKPQQPLQRVNLQNYDMVAFTRTGHRFVNYLLDSLFLFPMFIGMINLVTAGINIGYREELPYLVLLFVFLVFFLYYFISETIFGQTFGKIITNSCVATIGVEFSRGRMFIRTLCRLIPFNRISFLFGANWHDRVSSTAVVYVDSWEKAFDDKPSSEQA